MNYIICNYSKNSNRRVTLTWIRFVAFLAAVVCLSQRTAHANLTNQCWVYKDSHPWMNANQIVPIYIHVWGGDSVPDATSLTIEEFTDAVKRAINIWNEQSGSSLKLRYDGTIAFEPPPYSLVISGGDCGDPAEADADAYFEPSFGGWLVSQITLYKFVGLACDTEVPWRTNPSNADDMTQRDIVAVLVHEIGHAVFNIGHPNPISGDFPYEDCDSLPLAPHSAMGRFSRNLSNWDLELVQQRYGSRAQFGIFQKSHMISDTSWRTVTEAAPGSGATPLFRMGSLGQFVDARPLGWVENDGSNVHEGGAGANYVVAQYQAAQMNLRFDFSPSLGRPIAIASQPATELIDTPPTELITAYMKSFGSNIYEDPRGQVCWRTSSDNGVSWGDETCGPNDKGTEVYGLTATYEPFTKNFMISYASNVDLHSEINQIVFLVVPSSQSTLYSYAVTIISEVEALHAPSVACPGDDGKCLMTFETASGILGGASISIGSTGQVTVWEWFEWDIPFWDTPGLAYSPDDDTYRLVKTESSNTIYSFKAPRSTLVWEETDTVWQDDSSQISTAVLTYRVSEHRRSIESWHIKYRD